MKKGKIKIFGITGVTVILLISAIIVCATMAYAEDVHPEETVEESAINENIPAGDEIIVTDTTDISVEAASTSEAEDAYIENDLEDIASPSEAEYIDIENDLEEIASPSEAEYEEVDIEYKDSETIILPALERDGYVFVEWNTKEDGSGESFHAGEAYKVEMDGNLYAIWKKADDTQDENQAIEAETEEPPADSLKTDIVQTEQPLVTEPEEEFVEPIVNINEEASAESVTEDEAVPLEEVIEETPSEPEGNEMQKRE